MSNNQLPTDVQKQISHDSIKRFPNSFPHLVHHTEAVEYQRLGYIAGATAEAERAQKLADDVDRIREIIKGLTAAETHRFPTLQYLDDELAKALQQWEEGKEEPVKEIEYMPILSAELRELRAFNDVPVSVPMHLLNKAQAESNHGQTLQRLKERGGLGIKEALSLITLKNWSYYRDLPMKEAIAMLNDLIINPPN